MQNVVWFNLDFEAEKARTQILYLVSCFIIFSDLFILFFWFYVVLREWESHKFYVVCCCISRVLRWLDESDLGLLSHRRTSTLGTAGVRSPQVSVLWGTVKHIRNGKPTLIMYLNLKCGSAKKSNKNLSISFAIPSIILAVSFYTQNRTYLYFVLIS